MVITLLVFPYDLVSIASQSLLMAIRLLHAKERHAEAGSSAAATSNAMQGRAASLGEFISTNIQEHAEIIRTDLTCMYNFLLMHMCVRAF